MIQTKPLPENSMSAFQIHYGAAWRAAGMLLLAALAFATVFTSAHWYQVAYGVLLSIIAVPLLGGIGSAMLKSSTKPRFGLATIGINLAMTYFASVTLGIMKGLPHYMEAILVALTAWHAFATYQRLRLYRSGAYLSIFEPKPKPPTLRAQINAALAAHRN
jgi:hypothetical protein